MRSLHLGPLWLSGGVQFQVRLEYFPAVRFSVRIVQLANERFALSIQLRFVAQALRFFNLGFLSIVGPPATDDEDGSADQKNKCDADDYACYCATRETTG